MAATLPLMTNQQAAGSGMAAAHSDGQAIFNAALTALNSQRSGAAVIAIGVKAVTIAAATIDPGGAVYGGKPAMAVLAFIDATLLEVLTCVWSGNDLVITGDVNATAETALFWFVDGRA